jgi:hypothetical protein
MRTEVAARPDRRPWLLFGLLAAVYLLTFRGHFGSRDEEALYMTTVWLTKSAEAALRLSLTTPEAGGVQTPLYWFYEFGQPVLAIPLYLLADRLAGLFPLADHTYVTRFVLTLFNVGVTAATVAQLYRLGRALGYGARAATLTALVYGLGTLAWPYSRTFFRDPLVGLALVSTALALVRWRVAGGRRLALGAGGWLLLAVASKLTAVVLVPLFVAYALSGPAGRRYRARLRRREAIAAPRYALVAVVVAVLLLGGAVFLGVRAKFDDLHGHYDLVGRVLAGRQDLSYAARALYGLTLSPGKGLLPFAPPVLAGLGGLWFLARTRRAEALLCGAAGGLFVLIYSFDTGWHGGACWGPRYLLPVLPLLMLPFGAFATRVWAARRTGHGQVGLVLLGVLLLAGGVVQVAALAVDPIQYYLDVLRRHPLTLETGPDYLQEIHFDPALSPIPGHLALAVQNLETLAAGRTNFYPVPYEPEAYWKYFQYLAAPDSAWVHLAGWSQAGGYRAATNAPPDAVIVADPAAAGGRAVQGAPGGAALMLTTPPAQFPGGPYQVWARLRVGAADPAQAVVRLTARSKEAVLATREIPAGALAPGGGYQETGLDVVIDYAHPVWFEVQATGVTTVTLDGLRVQPSGPLSPLPLAR